MSERGEPVTACLIIIGNEILSGRTVDANLSYSATRLGEIGIRMAEARVVPDDEAAIVEAVTSAGRVTATCSRPAGSALLTMTSRRRASRRLSAAASSATG